MTDARERVWLVTVVSALAVVFGWIMFHPEASRPPDILDFGEFLPYLKRTNNFLDQVGGILQYTIDQSGRANVVPIVVATLKWRLFGDAMVGWQLTRAIVMVVLSAQMALLARRFGATFFGCIVAAATLLVAPAAARGWVRLTMGEPIGMLVVLALTLRAFDFHRTTRWPREVVWFALGTVYVVLVKEIMLPAMGLPLAVALCVQEDGRYGLPLWDRRSVVLTLVCALVAFVALAPLAMLYLNASESAFATQYGKASKGAGDLFAMWLSTVVPFPLGANPPSVMWGVAFIAFLLTVGFGWAVAVRRDGGRGAKKWLLIVLLLLALIGAVSYLPWPAYEDRYAFPYLAAPALLLALGVSALQRESKLLGGVAVVAWTAVAVYAGTAATAVARRADAAQWAADDVIRVVHAERTADSVYMATARQIYPEWTGLGPTMARLAAVTDRPWPPTVDIRCPEISSHLRRRPRLTVVSHLSQCRGLVTSGTHFVRRYRRMDWASWSVVSDSVRVDIFNRPEDIRDDRTAALPRSSQ